MKLKDYSLFINGEWKRGEQFYDLKSPYSGEVIARIPLANKKDVIHALDSAKKASRQMRKLSALERSKILERVSEKFEERLEECAYTLAMENAKPINAARGEIQRTIETYKFAAEEAKKITGETIPMDAAQSGKGRFGFTKKEPLGVIAAITPFNFPFNLVAHKLGPAFATGNTVVLKPASQTPLSAIMTAEIFEEAGLPKGALNVLFGKGGDIGDLLVTNPNVKMITFTGSVEVGLQIKEKAGLKKTTLELGSNSAVIVNDVNNIEAVARRCAEGAFAYSGQTCISVQRIYVHHTLYDDFLEAFIQETKRVKVGDPMKEDTVVSSLIHPKEAKRIENWLQEVDSKNIVQGGEREGSIIEPTVITNVNPDMAVSCQEAFAPIVSVNKYKDWEEAIKLVNDSQYGLQAGVYTNSIDKAFAAVHEIEVGGVIVNDIPSFRVDQMPYGGVKNSGTGREGIKYSMEEMCELKLGVFNLL
ncbi:aldehyde dehydrogenase [Oceanobacillus oncorhynchi subsp. incaldanensis]|uniref:aldehyde dehydrogenase family protein n=1 Tax=Oceanobacillus oncorhynchi TaxID=545501 RepID=UPI001B1637A2|nr:aldehyde dehydrogenase family protein [Oceanobacillus oncorhynchi]GIO20269.1 aldehyde dehydrogenase [Oceanobacillus oncorhynchi subsp. incaldanensis]